MANKRKVEDELSDDDKDQVTKKRKKGPKIVQFIEEDEEDVTISQEVADIPLLEEAEVGVIEKVSVVNFMCHAKLEVKLGPHVNFIIGRNGSGKSAILSGIIVGLGGKAIMTHRGSSLKNFIKEGCSFANIAVTLRNRGTDAYKRNEYGDSIIVERRITRDGAGAYKIKNGKTEKIVSNRKDELIAILDQFNIQIDNPVSILTQDTARSFLNSSDNKNKYALFLKATQLEQMSSNYQQINEDKNINMGVIERKMKAVKELYDHVKELEEKYKDMQKLQDLKISIVSLKQELAWAMVAEKREEADEASTAASRYEVRIPNYESKLQDMKEKGEIAKREIEEKKKELMLATVEAQSLGAQKTELGERLKKKKKEFKYVQDSRRKIEKEIRIAEKDKQALEDGIQDLKNTAQRDLEAEQNELDQQIEEKRKELKQYQAQYSTSYQYLNQLTEAIKNNQNKKYELSREISDSKGKVDKLRNRVMSLQNSQKNSLAAFGGSTGSIIRAIDQYYASGKFHKKPLGPMGSLIKLKDARWAIAVEQCLKSNIAAYACHDSHDMALLKQIFKKHRTKKEGTPPIIVSRFCDYVYDVSRNKPQCSYPAVMDILGIEHPVVANSLIDQCNIEITLLIEKASEAQRVIWQDHPPSKKAISIEGHEIIGGRSTVYYPCKKTDARYLQADIGTAIRKCEQELIQAQNHQKALDHRMREIEQETRRDKGEFESVKKKSRNEQDYINNIEAEIQDLMNVEVEQPPDVTVLESELVDVCQKIRVLVSELTDKNMIVDQHTDDLRQESDEFKECEKKCNTAIEKLEKLVDEELEWQAVLEKLNNNEVHCRKKLDEIMTNIKKAKDHHEKLVKAYEETRAQAFEFCNGEEKQPSDNRKKLESKLSQTEKRIQKEEARKGDCEEVVTKYQTALRKYQDTKSCIKNLKAYNKSIEKALYRRARRFEKFQQALTLRAKTYFDMMLSHRGYSGKMRINHEEETLSIAVNVENAKGATTKDTKALSGGERSFSTICFIMSMWEAMEAPFRCLDEFDVFMDMLNRRISMKLLMDIAQQQCGRQFILLTPLDMSNVAGSDKVKIFKLSDPERGQQTIDFQPVG